MDIPQETEEYIKESIGYSLGLPVSSKTLELKLLVSENDRNRLQDQNFILQERLIESQKRVDQYKAEATMNAQGLRKRIEEREVIVKDYESLSSHCAKLEKECMLYEKDYEKLMESYDELAKENDDLRAQLNDNSSVAALTAEIETLQKDKEHLRINLLKAEDEVKALFEENRLLEEQNKKLLRKIQRKKHHQGSESQPSACCTSSNGKRKCSLKEGSPNGRIIDFGNLGSPRKPFSPLPQLQNSPDSNKMLKTRTIIIWPSSGH